MNKKRIEQDAFLSVSNLSLYTHYNMLLACIVAIISYLAVRFIQPFHMDFAQSLLLVLYVGASFLYTKLYFPLTKKHYVLIGFILVCCIPNLLYDNYVLKFFNCVFILSLLAYFLLDVSNKRLDTSGKFFLLDMINATLEAPLQGCKQLLQKLRSIMKKSFQVQHFAGILIGIVVTLPLLAIILPLLTSADASFQRFIFDFFSNIDQMIIEILYVIFAIPVFVYLYSLLYSHMNCEKDEIVRASKQNVEQQLQKTACVPVSIPLTIELILIFLYTVFLCVSIGDILNNLNLSLNEFSYSQFARQGFFQLCMISSINLMLIIFLQFFTKRDTSTMYNIIKRVLCFITLLLLCSAATKMALYIYSYGLTPLRIYSSWFLIVLFGIFILIIYYTNHHEEKIQLQVIRYICICFLILNMLNINTFISWYNNTMPVEVQPTDIYTYE